VHDTDICCWVLLLQSHVGQSQHCTSDYFHFSLKHLHVRRCSVINDSFRNWTWIRSLIM